MPLPRQVDAPEVEVLEHLWEKIHPSRECLRKKGASFFRSKYLVPVKRGPFVHGSCCYGNIYKHGVDDLNGQQVVTDSEIITTSV